MAFRRVTFPSSSGYEEQELHRFPSKIEAKDLQNVRKYWVSGTVSHPRRNEPWTKGLLISVHFFVFAATFVTRTLSVETDLLKILTQVLQDLRTKHILNTSLYVENTKWNVECVHKVLVGKPEGKRPLGRPRRRWEDNIKMDLQEVGRGCGDWM